MNILVEIMLSNLLKGLFLSLSVLYLTKYQIKPKNFKAEVKIHTLMWNNNLCKMSLSACGLEQSLPYFLLEMRRDK